MGAETFVIENGLYGFKTDLKNALGDGEVPNWLYPCSPRSSGDSRLSRDADAERFLEANVERARGEHDGYPNRSRASHMANFEVFCRETGTPKHIAYPSLAPERVRGRISEWRDGNEKRVLRESGAQYFRGPRVRVEFGNRGAVTDVALVVEYGN